MNLFDQLVNEALENQPDLSSLRIVVEKELLHHDILRILSQNNLLTHLTFIGGTCLRSCYGGVRLSEDLDFAGGNEFTRDSLSEMGQVLIESLNEKYGLSVKVSEPKKDINDVDTWKVKVETRPEQKHLPAQRINIDICSVPSYENRPMMLLNPYGVDMGTSGLIIRAQSLEEIYTDKLIAFSLRPNRLKYRDLWDMVWLRGQGVTPKFELIPNKLQDRNHSLAEFLDRFGERQESLSQRVELSSEFKNEMRRFLPEKQMSQAVGQDDIWVFIVWLVENLSAEMRKVIS